VAPQRFKFVFSFLVVCVTVLFVRRRIWRVWSCRTDVVLTTLIATFLTMGSLQGVLKIVPKGPAPAVPFLKVLYPVIYFVVAFFAVYAVLTTISYFLARRAPERVAVYVELLRKGLRAESAGLAIVRGAAAGWIVIVIYLLVVGLSHFVPSGVPSISNLIFARPAVYTETAFPAAIELSVVVLFEAFIATWLLTALPIALLHAVTRRRAVIIGVCALAWCLVPFWLRGADALFASALTLFGFLAVQAAIVATILLRYDLLTTFFAVVTVEMWLLTWPGYLVFHRVETFQYFLVLSAWFLVLLWGAVLYFRSQLTSGWGRLKAVFE
jgi:hypothetical protein